MEPQENWQRSPEEILAEFERNTAFRWPNERATLIQQAISLLEAQGRTEQVQQMKWEAALFWHDLRKLKKAKDPRFGPMATSTNGTEIPDPAIFTEEALSYYEWRLSNATNPILRSWYADFLWERKHNHMFAREAIRAYYDCYPICIANEWWMEAADSLVRPLRLALRLNDTSLVQEAKAKILDALAELEKRHSHPAVGFCLDLVDAILELDKKVSHQDLKKALAACQAGAEFYASGAGDRNYHLAQGFADREATIQSKLGQEEGAHAARLRIGQYFEDDAELEGGANNLRGASLLQEAAQHYANIGCADKADELKIKVRERYKAAVQGGEFGRISAEVTIPVKEIENHARELLKHGLDKALLGLAADPGWIPDIEKAREKAQQSKQDFPLLGLIPRSTIRGTRQVNQAASQEEINEANALNDYAIDAALKAICLSHTLKVFINEGGLNSSLLVQHLSRSPFLEMDILDIVSVGVERYFAEDYVSALHVLVPKLEETLRRAIGKLGVSTTSQGSDGFTREKPLDVVLETPELIKLLGDRAVFYFNYMLIHQLGENLRNDVAHGLLAKDRCTKELTEQIIHLYLLLTPFEVQAAQGS